MGGCACCNRGGPNDYASKEIKCLDLPEGDDNVIEEHAKKIGGGQQENDDVIFNHVASTLRSSKEEINVQVE